jgi:hypothetical protein
MPEKASEVRILPHPFLFLQSFTKVLNIVQKSAFGKLTFQKQFVTAIDRKIGDRKGYNVYGWIYK